MNKVKDYVNFRLTHSDKTYEAEGYPLELSDCKKYKPMRELKIYGNSYQDGTPTPDNPIEVQSVGELVTDEADANYGKYTIPVVVKGKNIYNATTILKSNRLTAVDTINVKPHTDYVISVDKYTISNPWWAVRGLKEPRENIPSSEVWSAGEIIKNQAITFNSGEYEYIVIRQWYPIIDNGVAENAQIQIEEGTIATEFEPYIEPITTNIFLNEPLRMLGDYADYVDFKENKVVRRNREVIPKPEDITYHYKSYAENYGYYIYGTGTNYPDAYTVQFNGWGEHIQPEKSTHFIANNKYSVCGVPGDWHIAAGIRFLLAPEFQASDGVSSTFEDIRAWMQSQIDAGTPLKFTYRLAEPTEEPLNIDLPKLTTKTTIIEVDTSLAPSAAYGKYIKR